MLEGMVSTTLAQQVVGAMTAS